VSLCSRRSVEAHTWGYWIAAWAGNAAITVAFVGYLAVFWPALNSHALLAALVGIAVIWFLTLVNSLGAGRRSRRPRR
jgi:APA family basic amino acid/polyamine antiporter